MAIKFGPNELIRDEHFLVISKAISKTKNGDDFYTLELNNKDGKIEAKIWNNNIPQCNFEVGKVIELNGKTQEYNGKISIVMDSCQTVMTEEIGDYSPSVPTMVFDIECMGKKFEELDEDEQDYLLNNLEKGEENKEIAKRKTGLYSIFGIVCAVGIFDSNTKKGKVLVLNPENKDLAPENEDYDYESFKDEKSLLIRFWELSEKYELFVTYNGESFDFPYLIIRSGINRVRVPLAIKKWSENFIDLQNKIKQSNRPFKLEFLCKAFNIENPKEEGVHGDQVSELFNSGEYNKIADYVSRDAFSTNQLYLVWKNYMSGQI